jgi:hypothetical protein
VDVSEMFLKLRKAEEAGRGVGMEEEVDLKMRRPV